MARESARREQLSDQTRLLRDFQGEGLGFCAVGYPGYGEAPGSASEDSVYAAGEAVLAALRGRGIDRAHTVLEGYSLGTGAATEMARRGLGSRLLLLAPLFSVDVMVEYRSSFARRLVRDHFDNLGKAPSITIPVLVIHGNADEVLPFELGKKLAGRFPHANFVEVAGAPHNGLIAQPGVFRRIVRFAKDE